MGFVLVTFKTEWVKGVTVNAVGTPTPCPLSVGTARAGWPCTTTMDDQMINEAPEISRGHRQGDGIRTVTSSTFSELVLEGDGPVVVEFMSYGCAYCRVIEPVLQQVAERVKSEDKIFRVNVAVERGLAESYEIHSTPTLVMFLNGREVGRVEGPDPTVSSVLTVMTQAFG